MSKPFSFEKCMTQAREEGFAPTSAVLEPFIVAMIEQQRVLSRQQIQDQLWSAVQASGDTETDWQTFNFRVKKALAVLKKAGVLTQPQLSRYLLSKDYVEKYNGRASKRLFPYLSDIEGSAIASLIKRQDGSVLAETGQL